MAWMGFVAPSVPFRCRDREGNNQRKGGAKKKLEAHEVQQGQMKNDMEEKEGTYRSIQRHWRSRRGISQSTTKRAIRKKRRKSENETGKTSRWSDTSSSIWNIYRSILRRV